jgi:hypothetical protein
VSQLTKGQEIKNRGKKHCSRNTSATKCFVSAAQQVHSETPAMSEHRQQNDTALRNWQIKRTPALHLQTCRERGSADLFKNFQRPLKGKAIN